MTLNSASAEGCAALPSSGAIATVPEVLGRVYRQHSPTSTRVAHGRVARDRRDANAQLALLSANVCCFKGITKRGAKAQRSGVPFELGLHFGRGCRNTTVEIPDF